MDGLEGQEERKEGKAVKLSKRQKWTLGLGYLGFIVLVIVADTVSYLLGKNGVVSDSTARGLQRGSAGVLFIFFIAFWINVSNRGDKKL